MNTFSVTSVARLRALRGVRLVLVAAVALLAFVLLASPVSASEPEMRVVVDDHFGGLVSRDAGSSGLGLASVRDTVVCFDDGVSGPRIEVLHVVPDSKRVPVPFGEIRRNVAKVATIVEESSRRHGGARILTPRFVHDDRCRPTVTQVSVPAAVYFKGYAATVNWMMSEGYDRSDRTYLLLVNDTVADLCGRATFYNDDTPGPENDNNHFVGFAYVARQCWDQSETHEIFHTLGAVNDSAPHSTGFCRRRPRRPTPTG